MFEMACQLMEEGETVGLLALLDCDPNTGKHMHRAFDDWTSVKASVRRAVAELTVREFGLKELLHRRMVYQRIKIRAWRASRLRGAARTNGSRRLEAEGYLALALRDHQLTIYSGDVTLISARDNLAAILNPLAHGQARFSAPARLISFPEPIRGILNRPYVISLAREIEQKLMGRLQSSVTRVVA